MANFHTGSALLALVSGAVPRVFMSLILALLSACSANVSEPSSPRLPPARLTLLSGGNQTVRLGSTLTQPIMVRLDTAGVPAQSEELEFTVVADTSPGPNHTWYAYTDQSGIASGNGVITNTGARPATITVKYKACVAPNFLLGCERFETQATVATSIIVTQ